MGSTGPHIRLSVVPVCLLAHPPSNDGDNDDDEDGLLDVDEVEIHFTDPLDPDSDDDGRGDANDNCPNTPNNDQRNTDNQDDGGDACDNDDDKLTSKTDLSNEPFLLWATHFNSLPLALLAF